jgi:hypothetical protein
MLSFCFVIPNIDCATQLCLEAWPLDGRTLLPTKRKPTRRKEKENKNPLTSSQCQTCTIQQTFTQVHLIMVVFNWFFPQDRQTWTQPSRHTHRRYGAYLFNSWALHRLDCNWCAIHVYVAKSNSSKGIPCPWKSKQKIYSSAKRNRAELCQESEVLAVNVTVMWHAWKTCVDGDF